jgi:hypothetical protein
MKSRTSPAWPRNGRSGCTRKAASSTPCLVIMLALALRTYIDAAAITEDREG